MHISAKQQDTDSGSHNASIVVSIKELYSGFVGLVLQKKVEKWWKIFYFSWKRLRNVTTRCPHSLSSIYSASGRLEDNLSRKVSEALFVHFHICLPCLRVSKLHLSTLLRCSGMKNPQSGGNSRRCHLSRESPANRRDRYWDKKASYFPLGKRCCLLTHHYII